MLKVVLYQPEIPPNTGNIIRLCANSGCSLHLIEPLGFTLEDKKLRRAGLDYREFANICSYPDFSSFRAQHPDTRVYALTTRGTRGHHEIAYQEGDGLLFGPETRGLPTDILQSLGEEHAIRIPMAPGSRSLNLSNAAALVVYEGLRQLGFPTLS